MNAEKNVAAFLSMIAHAEGTSKVPDPYRCCYAYRESIDGKDGISGTFDDWVDHPTVTGEWAGEPLSEKMCRAAGIASGKCRSTAAGRYQFIVGTWKELKSQLSLPDFSPESQDKAAIEQIRQKGALDDVRAGRIPEAISKVRRVWASMPAAGFGQPERKLVELLRVYKTHGGQLEQ